MRGYEIFSRPKIPCKEPLPPCRCRRNTTSLFDLIKRPLDWFLCTPLKVPNSGLFLNAPSDFPNGHGYFVFILLPLDSQIPIPHFEWHDISSPKSKEESCSSTPSVMHSCERKCCQPQLSPSLDSCPRPRSRNPCGSKEETNPPEKSHGEFTFCGEYTEGFEYFKENPGCDCSPCRIRRILEGPLTKEKETAEGAKHEKNNSHLRICDCGPCRVRRTLEKPIC
ncbi:uncharacterized protein LOC107219144 isoform X1 [Neodiprion lecontei]|uniref:Uncharacterized protein LOC107219144 isoform X1 n=1 Tax=Neodiprion lecontei TaxID=441921 RepID=A0ABM3GC41_NEOLC|nr:uncharacterized protein LOC124219876 isoform X1 [Neodiprion pinetum]XP_046484055.1 uncharacterized protein LOC124219876 isoform X1 [Neodiprion pinetum]XP_046597804.1 uncharacterized protein LOC107219144 isoform X1 [Neodiprion lecontei]